MKIFILLFLSLNIFAQTLKKKPVYTLDDTLRGTITPERIWWDLKHYDLNVKVDVENKTFIGTNVVKYRVLSINKIIQIDMQEPMQILEVTQDNVSLNWVKKGKNAYFIQLQKLQIIGENEQIIISFAGKPKIAVLPPWDGGVQWEKDSKGKDFIATTCQGLGASVWWPCKDHMYDEVDSMNINVTVPNGLQDISNGRLIKVTENEDNTTTFNWKVVNPINNYGVNINVGNYVNWKENYTGEKGNLSLNYYALAQNLEKAKAQFKEVPRMLKAFEHWFGPYPFYEDGYKLVEVPYLGMEHQSSITYGNKFMNGYLGRDLSGTGWGLKWDFIIVHESGHEWFANNITYKDQADMWIHESFTNYSENLFTEYHYGKEAGAAYVIGTRSKIENKEPIIPVYNVNAMGSGDMYYKGGNMLHTIRQIVNNDEKWRGILRGLNSEFYHQTVTTAQIENYISKNAGIKLGKVFDQYLRNTSIPVFEYYLKKNKLCYKWTNCVTGFDMPILLDFSNLEKKIELKPTTGKWTSIKIKKKNNVLFNKNYYVDYKLIK